MLFQANDIGDYFPVWGTCLGFEIMSLIAAENDAVMTNCSDDNIAGPLNISPGHHWKSNIIFC